MHDTENKLLDLYNTKTSLGWHIIVGADHGKGAWLPWVKIFNKSRADLRKIQEDGGNDAKGCIIAQVVHGVCKKDTPKILASTISDALSCGYDNLLTSCLVCVRSDDRYKTTKGFLITKHAQDKAIQTNISTQAS